MKKLKCWKKLRTTKTDDVWRDSKKDINVGVYPNVAYPLRKGFEVDIDKGIGKVKTIGKNKGLTKSKALSIAGKYMKEHNSC